VTVARPTENGLHLPWTGEFTPGQLGERALEETLAIVAGYTGNRAAIVEAIRALVHGRRVVTLGPGGAAHPAADPIRERSQWHAELRTRGQGLQADTSR